MYMVTVITLTGLQKEQVGTGLVLRENARPKTDS